MFLRQTIVTVVRAGKPSAAYVGTSPEEALKVYEREAANVENEDVRYYAFPAYAKFATPAAHAESLASEQAERKAVETAQKNAAAIAQKTAEEKAERAAKTEARRKEILTAIDKAESALGESEDAAARKKNSDAIAELVKELNALGQTAAAPAPAKPEPKAAPAKKAK